MVPKTIGVRIFIFLVIQIIVLVMFSIALGTDYWNNLEHKEPKDWKNTPLPPGTTWTMIEPSYSRVFHGGLFTQCFVPRPFGITGAFGRVSLMVDNNTVTDDYHEFETTWRYIKGKRPPPASIRPSQCEPGQFMCESQANDFSAYSRNTTSEYCIGDWKKCDDRRNCLNGEDEVGCTLSGCIGKIKCNNTNYCVDYSDICNGWDDCGDGEDEKNCTGNCDSLLMDLCGDGKCRESHKRCDGIVDCPDNHQDEISCTDQVCREANGNASRLCYTGRCSDAIVACDGHLTCGGDIKLCEHRVKQRHKSDLMDYDPSGKCIRRRFDYSKPYQRYSDNAIDKYYEYEDSMFRGVIGLIFLGLILTLASAILILVLILDIPRKVFAVIVVLATCLAVLAFICFLAAMALFTHWAQKTVNEQLKIFSINDKEVDPTGHRYIYSLACKIPENQWACHGVTFLWSFYLGWIAVFVCLLAVIINVQTALIISRHSKYEVK